MKEFEPTGLGLTIFKKRYAFHPEESWGEACDRVAAHVSMAEQSSLVAAWKAKFTQALKSNLFMPGGRIWYGSGRPRGQLLNCFVIPSDDSREGWGRSISDIICIAGTGGGVGINCSPVRPRGTPINGTGGYATGAVSLMEIINAAGEVIKAGGGRRTALMLCLGLNHGDIQEFLDKKLDLKQLNNANVSVVFDDDPEVFFSLVKDNKQHKLNFKDKEVGSVSASAIWEKIVGNSLKSGEPGVLNGYLANKMSNTWYIAPLVSTNPCGEIWLIPYDCCCLGSLVLPRFVKDNEIDWDLLDETVATGVRFLDDVLTVNHYPLPEIERTCREIRRIGLGVMGLHDMLLMLGLKYNSPEGLEMVDKVMKRIKDNAYKASIELAKEKGPFPAFRAEQFLKSGFIKTLKPTIRKAIQDYGIRNCACLTIPPTGTTAMVCGCSAGIESLYAPAYERRWRDGDNLAMDVQIHPLLEQFVKEGRDVSHFQGSYDLSIRDHLEIQRICQKHIDNAVSKTINIPKDISIEELSALYMEYIPELKGITVYPEGSRENQPLTPISLKDAKKLVGTVGVSSDGMDNCKDGKCDL